ncbi:MAG: mannosyltransferase family protein [Vicinamibacterales bacterium]
MTPPLLAPPSGSPPPPAWARLADAATVVLALLAISALATGGFRTEVAGWRVSVTAWWRPALAAVLVALARHAACRAPSMAVRMVHGTARWWRDPTTQATWPVVAASRLGVLTIGLLAVFAIGFPEGRAPIRVAESEIGNLPARFDAGWYLGIATHGYEYQPGRVDRQQNLVFFPAFPVLMSLGSLLLARQILWAGTLLSIVAFAWAARYLYRLAREMLDADRAAAAVAFAACYPFALFYSAPYTEALFLLAMLGAWFHLRRDERWAAFGWGLLAGLTRPNGCLLSIPLALVAVDPWWRGGRLQAPPGGWSTLADRFVVAAAPGLGMLLYSAYIADLTGDPFTWIRLQAAWGRQNLGAGAFLFGEAEAIGQLGVYQYATGNVPNFLNLLALTLTAAALWPVARRFGPAAAALLLLNVVPSLATGGLLSVGRATTVLFPTFLWLADAVPARHRTAWLAAFAGLQAFAATLFFTWRQLF